MFPHREICGRHILHLSPDLMPKAQSVRKNCKPDYRQFVHGTVAQTIQKAE